MNANRSFFKALLKPIHWLLNVALEIGFLSLLGICSFVFSVWVFLTPERQESYPVSPLVEITK
jgi:hypothetical protein